MNRIKAQKTKSRKQNPTHSIYIVIGSNCSLFKPKSIQLVIRSTWSLFKPKSIQLLTEKPTKSRRKKKIIAENAYENEMSKGKNQKY